MVTCSGCDKTWSGLKMAHCSQCHETFSTVGNFDKHRVSHGGGTKCVRPEDCDMIQNQNGTWMKNGERDVSRLGLLRGSAPRVDPVADDTLSDPES